MMNKPEEAVYVGPLQNRSASQPAPVYTPGRGGCLTEGCTCKDARVLNYRHMRFIKALAERRGETVDRVVPAGDLSALLVRPDEPENIQSEETEPTVTVPAGRRETGIIKPPTCECSTCRNCSNIRTVESPTRCADCKSGTHLGAG